VTAGKPLTLTATVTGSAATPTGTMSFRDDGSTLPNCSGLELSDAGVASCPVTKLPAGSYTLKASYSGDASYGPATDTIPSYPVIANPSINASLSSSTTKSTYGWYRTAVTVTFGCADGTGALVAPGCPTPVTLSASKQNQMVTETIYARDGGTATVQVNGINIDRIKPTVTVTGATNGHSYPTPRKLTCNASDQLSGIASCKIATHKGTSHGVTTVSYTATATDKAGNTATTKGAYKIKT
jgi:adhesin/invasin